MSNQDNTSSLVELKVWLCDVDEPVVLHTDYISLRRDAFVYRNQLLNNEPLVMFVNHCFKISEIFMLEATTTDGSILDLTGSEIRYEEHIMDDEFFKPRVADDLDVIWKTSEQGYPNGPTPVCAVDADLAELPEVL